MDGLSRRAALAGAGGLVASAAGVAKLAGWTTETSAKSRPDVRLTGHTRFDPSVTISGVAPTAAGYLALVPRDEASVGLAGLTPTGDVRFHREYLEMPAATTSPHRLEVSWADGAVLVHGADVEKESRSDRHPGTSHRQWREVVIRVGAAGAESWRYVRPADRPASVPEKVRAFVRADGGAVLASFVEATDEPFEDGPSHRLWTRHLDPSGRPTETRQTPIDLGGSGGRMAGVLRRTGDAVTLLVVDPVLDGPRLRQCTLTPDGITIGDGRTVPGAVEWVRVDATGSVICRHQYSRVDPSSVDANATVFDSHLDEVQRYDPGGELWVTETVRLGDGDLLAVGSNPRTEAGSRLLRLAGSGTIRWDVPVSRIETSLRLLVGAMDRFATYGLGKISTYDVAIGSGKGRWATATHRGDGASPG